MITNEDLRLVTQKVTDVRIKIEVLDDNNKIIDTVIGGIVGGSSSINAESDIRRTFQINVIPLPKTNLTISEDGLVWPNRTVRLSIGLKNNRTEQYMWYRQGSYVFTNTSASYDTANNQLTLDCSDLMTRLDGTKNGQLGALTTLFPAYEENEETGEIIKYNCIRDAIITVLTRLGRIQDYNIDDVGEYKAMPQYNENYEKYRKENPLWNTIPYDLEFSCGCSVLSILTAFRDLYPNYEMFFDENGTFICQMIPGCYYDDITIDNSFLQKILISENTSVDMTTVRNICEVWGQVIDAGFYTEDAALSGDCYVCSISGYDEKYYTGDIIAIKIPAANPADSKLNINGLGAIDICDENTDAPLEKSMLEPGTVYVFKIKQKSADSETITQAYFLGQWQAHGLNVLVNGSASRETHITAAGVKVAKYSKEYFQDVYNCESVELTTIPNSPFTVQKIGEILDVKTGGEYENITSDSLALARAEYENWKNCRMTDSISITTKLCPFADVNKKVSYKRSDSNETYQYIVKSISHNWDNGTTSWSLIRFYPLYADTLKEMGIHKVLSAYSHGLLGKYTHEQLTQFVENGAY